MKVNVKRINNNQMLIKRGCCSVVVDNPAESVDHLNPYELLTGSMGSCLALNITQFCKTRSIPSRGLEIEVNFEKKDGRLNNINFTVKMPFSLDDKNKKILTNYLKHCSVLKTMIGFTESSYNIELMEVEKCYA